MAQFCIRFDMIYDCHFEMTAQIFVHKTIFVNSRESNPRDENPPKISIFVQRFFRSSWPWHGLHENKKYLQKECNAYES